MYNIILNIYKYIANDIVLSYFCLKKYLRIEQLFDFIIFHQLYKMFRLQPLVW